MRAEGTKPTVVILDSPVAVTGGFRCAQRMAGLLSSDARFVLALPENSGIPDSELAPFAAVERLPLVELRKSVRSLLGYGPALFTSGKALRDLLDRHGARTLVVNDFFQLQGWVARRLGWKGRIVTWVRFDPWRFPRPIARIWLGAAAEASAEVVAVSRFIADRLPPGLRAVQVYDCIDPSLRRRKDGPTPRDVAFVGNYIPGKGQDHALEAFAAVADEFPDARLLFFGGDMGLEKNRAFRRSLEARSSELGLAERVRFHGFATDLRDVLGSARVVLNLSESESFSLSCLEAQQVGVPVVSFRSGGPEEIIIDGETGFLHDLGDIAGVARSLRSLLADEDLARSMGKAAAASARNRFGPEAFVRNIRPLLLGGA